jgi:hypothetical protein
MGTPATDAAKTAGASDRQNGGPGHSSHGKPDPVKKAYETGYTGSSKKS